MSDRCFVAPGHFQQMLPIYEDRTIESSDLRTLERGYIHWNGVIAFMHVAPDFADSSGQYGSIHPNSRQTLTEVIELHDDTVHGSVALSLEKLYFPSNPKPPGELELGMAPMAVHVQYNSRFALRASIRNRFSNLKAKSVRGSK